MNVTIKDVYDQYLDLTNGDGPRSLEELRNVIHANDLRYEDIPARFASTEEDEYTFWDLIFDSGWASGESDDIPLLTNRNGG